MRWLAKAIGVEEAEKVVVVLLLIVLFDNGLGIGEALCVVAELDQSNDAIGRARLDEQLFGHFLHLIPALDPVRFERVRKHLSGVVLLAQAVNQ